MPKLPARLLRLCAVGLSLGALVVAPACGGPPAPKGGGGGDLYGKTFAGQNKCNPKNVDRPFIIDWDATDQSSFQAQAQNDVVFVRYEGCALKVLYGCRDDSVKGAFGSYKGVEWTSGGVESIDIHDEGELYAKLPLGAASLGGRVSSGEKFHMEYYVSGTRTATRDHVYREDLAKNPACAGATHFAYQFNLGAFALASTSKLKGEVNGSFFGFGTGGASSNESSADKKGGDLASCKADSANIVEACKVPVRLTLREISSESNPIVAAGGAPESDAALNLAGKVKAESDQEKKAAEHLLAANDKLGAKDGKGCVAELDQHDALDPRPSTMSTNPKAYDVAIVRAKCLDLEGKCDAGRELLRKALDAKGDLAPKALDRKTEELAAYCAGGKLTPREEFVAAAVHVANGMQDGKKVAGKMCLDAFATIKRLHGTVAPEDASDYWVARPRVTNFLASAVPGCLANADDCGQAFKVFVDIESDPVWKLEDQKNECLMVNCKTKSQPPPVVKKEDPKFLRHLFETVHPQCTGK